MSHPGIRASLLVLSFILAACSAPAAAAPASAAHAPTLQQAGKWTDTDGNFINAHGGGILHHNGVYYWYGEIKSGKTWAPDCNKSWGGTRVEMRGVSCYSSRDLLHWKNEGNVLPADQHNPASKTHKSKVLERPKVVFNRKTGKFVMWMHIDTEDYQLAEAGVAVADKPAGPFRFLGSSRPGGAMSRDMTIFADDDGKAYLFFSSENNATMRIALLSDDYLQTTSTVERVFIKRSMEAPAVFKRGGKYYFIASGCTGWAPNAARSAVADSIFGPWRELGNPCRGPEAETTFRGQGTFVLPIAGKPDEFVFLADRWNQWNLADSRHLWLPIRFTPAGFEIPWQEAWSPARR